MGRFPKTCTVMHLMAGSLSRRFMLVVEVNDCDALRDSEATGRGELFGIHSHTFRRSFGCGRNDEATVILVC